MKNTLSSSLSISLRPFFWRGSLLFLFIYLMGQFSFAAEKVSIDSLKSELKKEITGKEKGEIYYLLSETYGFKKPDSSLFYSKKLMNLQEKAPKSDTGFQKLIAKGYNNFAAVNHITGNTDSALIFFVKSVNILKKYGQANQLMDPYNNLAILFMESENYYKALDYAQKMQKAAIAAENKRQIIKSKIKIADIKRELDDFKSAEKLYREVIEDLKKEEEEFPKLKAMVYNNYAILKKRQGKEEEAHKLFLKVEKIAREHDFILYLTTSYNNIGNYYYNKNEFDKNLRYLRKAYRIRKKMGHVKGMSSNCNNMARTFHKMGLPDSVEHYGTLAIDLAEKINSPRDKAQAAEVLYWHYKDQGKMSEALKYHEIAMNITLMEKEKSNKREVYQLQYEFEYQQKAREDSIQAAKKKAIRQLKHQQEIQVQKRNNYLALGGAGSLGLILLIILFAYRQKKKRNRELEKKNKIIQEQKVLVDEKNREIIDSIKYAERIQQALLKNEEQESLHLPDHFIFFKPKDIISGDFYWALEKDGTMPGKGEPDQKFLYIAAADCTGHGVPGALLTMLGTSFLNEINAHEEILSPARILDRLKDKFVLELSGRQESSNLKDGMDISLACINMQTKKVAWAGANNPLWIIRKNDDQLVEIKPDKQPIGHFSKSKPFTNHEVQLEKGDQFYMFSDGFSDQFGGDKGKKYKSRRFKKFLLSIRNEAMEGQKRLLKEEINDWMGDIDQLDDICVIGVKT